MECLLFYTVDGFYFFPYLSITLGIYSYLPQVLAYLAGVSFELLAEVSRGGKWKNGRSS